MPTIRDVVSALSRRAGVDAVIVVGRDGLTIDAQARDGLDADSLAALVPSLVDTCSRLGSAAGRGSFGTGLVEYSEGLALVTELTPDAILAIFFKANTNVGTLLYELRRHGPAIAHLL